MAYSTSRHGTAHRAVALDLMLRTFMNSPDFQPYNPRMWEGIAKLVPGATPQQCIQRWEELRSTARFVTRDLSILAAKGRPISASQMRLISASGYIPNTRHSLIDRQSSVTELPPIDPTTRSSSIQTQYRGSVSTGGNNNNNNNKFAAAFCQSYLTKRDAEEDKKNEDKLKEGKTEQISEHKQNDNGSTADVDISSTVKDQLVIHVKDEAKKKNQDFTCPKELLMKEMKYFNDYLTSADNSQWEEVDISVHCDIDIFHWLMSYVKRGMKESPTGNPLNESLKPPELVSTNVVSLLISSDFLKMDSLVEECLDYCHSNMNELLAAPCNLNCIGGKILLRLVHKFSPFEVEKLNDTKDKMKNKIFFHLLERVFDPSYTHTECPFNASTLFKCQFCYRLLTQDQEKVIQCNPNRLRIDKNGRLIHKHERDYQWDIDTHLASLRQNNTSWRDIYWRLWGTITWSVCAECGEGFQYTAISKCMYHPSVIDPTTKAYLCCGRSSNSFSPIPSNNQNGCQYKDHVPNNSNNDITMTILNELRDTICGLDPLEMTSAISHIESSHTITSILRNEQLLHPAQSKIKISSQQTSYNVIDSTSLVKGLPRSELTDRRKSSISTSSSSSNSTMKRNKSLLISRRIHGDLDEEMTDNSELEEDDDACSGIISKLNNPAVKIHHHRHLQKKTPKRHSISKCKSSERGVTTDRSSILEMDWVWDNKQSTRWNQDMQRSQDDCRISQLKHQLNQLTPQSTNTSNESLRSVQSTCTNAQPLGGIYAQLEAQFMIANNKPHTQATGSRTNRKHSTSGRF